MDIEKLAKIQKELEKAEHSSLSATDWVVLFLTAAIMFGQGYYVKYVVTANATQAEVRHE